MSGEHERYATWDAAYAMGALSAADRSRFEAHLAHCARCRTAVSELTPVVGLLSRIPAERAESLGAAPRDPAADRLREIARARRRRRQRLVWAAASVAAAVAVAVPIALVALSPRPAVSVALEPAVSVPVTATVELTPVAWGTRIDMECAYGADAPDAGWTYVLTVIDASGAATELSTWKVEPGRTARVSAGVAERLPDIRAVEVRNAAGDVILRQDLETTERIG